MISYDAAIAGAQKEAIENKVTIAVVKSELTAAYDDTTETPFGYCPPDWVTRLYQDATIVATVLPTGEVVQQ